MYCDNTITDCPICMEVVQTNINRVITECGHIFHTQCLLTNIVHNGFGCPYCRTEMVPEELLRSEEDEENDIVAIIEDVDDDDDDDEIVSIAEDEESRADVEDSPNWLIAQWNNEVTIRRTRMRMNQMMVYERAHSAMRLMFARLEDNEHAEPEDVDFEDYSTIASDNSFDEEYNASEDDSESDSDGGIPTSVDLVDETQAVVDDVGEEVARATANHLPTVNRIAYLLERAEFNVDDFVRILLYYEYPQYSSVIESRHAETTYLTAKRLIHRIISRFQERIPSPTNQNNSLETLVPAVQDHDNEEDDNEPIILVETQNRIHALVGIDLD